MVIKYPVSSLSLHFAYFTEKITIEALLGSAVYVCAGEMNPVCTHTHIKERVKLCQA